MEWVDNSQFNSFTRSCWIKLNIMQEEWKDIQGYEGLYQVSNLGRVKSCSRIVYTGNGVKHKYQRLREHILKSSGAKYRQVILCKNGKTKQGLLHRLVAEAFIPNPDNLPCINHKDENPLNNRADNLEWCSYKYNNEYNNRIGRCRDKISKTLKKKQYHHKMTPEQIEHIRQGAYKGWETRRKNKSITEKEIIK